MKKILLVEDDILDAALTIRCLQKIPVQDEIVHLRDGEDFLNYLRQAEDLHLIRLAIMDLKMPRLDGLQVLQRIHDHRSRHYFPIVVFSSSDHLQDVRRCYQLGCNAYVAKPMNPRDFRNTIVQLGNFWLNANSAPCMA